MAERPMMMAQRRLSKARKEQIVLAYVLTTRGVLPDDLDKLLRSIRERVGGDVTEHDVRKAIKWALRQPRPRAASARPAERAAQHAQAPASARDDASQCP